MAEQNQTQIAQELQRIENARDLLAQKAVAWGLPASDTGYITYNDPEKGTSTLDEIAYGFNEINDNNENDVHIDGPNVLVWGGMYHTNVNKSVKPADRAETTIKVTVDTDDNELQIKAENKQGTGWVNADGSKDTALAYVELDVNGDTVTAKVRGFDQQTIQEKVAAGAYSVDVVQNNGTGYVTAEGKNNVGFDTVEKEPENGEYYIKVTGSGMVDVKGKATIDTTGYLTADSKETVDHALESGEAYKYLVLADSEFKNGAGESIGIPSINPLVESSITFSQGYTLGGSVYVSGELLARLQKI